MDSRATLSCLTQEGLPRSSTDLSPRAAPNHPGESGQVLALCFPTGVRLPPHGGTGHSLLANEAESDSLYAAAHGFAAVRLRRPWISPSSAHRATCRKSNYMVDSFHSTRSASLVLAHPCVSMRSDPTREKPHAHAWRFCRRITAHNVALKKETGASAIVYKKEIGDSE